MSPRIPLIKFIGKRSLEKIIKKVEVAPKVTNNTTTNIVKIIKEGTGVEFTTLKDGAWHGRPKLYDMEMEAVESGGANIVW